MEIHTNIIKFWWIISHKTVLCHISWGKKRQTMLAFSQDHLWTQQNLLISVHGPALWVMQTLIMFAIPHMHLTSNYKYLPFLDQHRLHAVKEFWMLRPYKILNIVPYGEFFCQPITIQRQTNGISAWLLLFIFITHMSKDCWNKSFCIWYLCTTFVATSWGLDQFYLFFFSVK